MSQCSLDDPILYAINNIIFNVSLIDWLFNGTSTKKEQFVPTVGRAQSAKDGQRDTMHITVR